MLCDIAIPTLPARDLKEAIAFYEKLGFQAARAAEAYVILCRGAIELHLFHLPDLSPTESYGGCYWRVSQVDELFQAFQAQVPSVGIPRLGLVEDKPWGMREFYVVDPSGNLLRIGQVIGQAASAN